MSPNVIRALKKPLFYKAVAFSVHVYSFINQSEYQKIVLKIK